MDETAIQSHCCRPGLFLKTGAYSWISSTPNFETVLVRLRLVSAGEGKDEALAGTLVISGRGAWPVVCVGPLSEAPCASTCLTSNCRRTASRFGPPNRATLRVCCWYVPTNPFDDRVVRDLPDLLEPGDVMVFNDTRVIPAQLKGIRQRGDATATVEATLHMRMGPERWMAFLRPAKRVNVGERISFGHTGDLCLAGTLTRHGGRKGRSRRSAARIRPLGTGPRRGPACGRAHPFAALHRLEACR